MKKFFVLWGVLFLITVAGFLQSRPAAAPEDTVFLKNGDMITGEITDISSDRLVLQFKDGREIPLASVWMINCIDAGKDFPEELGQITTDQHYVFLKSGDVRTGKIVDYSSEQKVFQFETGERFPHTMIKHIYFSKQGAGGTPAPPVSGPMAWIFPKSGAPVNGEIIDISSDRQFLQIKDQPEIALKDLFMINFVDGIRDFPNEVSQLREKLDYIFLRDGRIKTGILLDYSSERRVFELDNGGSYPPYQIKRIYLNYTR